MSKIEVNTVDAQCGSTITVGSSGKNVKIEGNDIRSNDYKASDGGNIVNQSGTTITIGASGDTVSLASGASQSGFGRSGSVNWQTGSIKTSTFTAANGEGYFINSSGSITANLPAGSAGAIVAFSDYARNFNTHNFIVSPNGSEKIGGIAGNLTLSVNGQALTLVYVDSTKGWVNVQNAEDTEVAAAFITATGGTITTVNGGACKVHTFTGPGTFCVSALSDTAANNEISYMIVGGGGGSGGAYSPGGGPGGTGGGGAGGFREVKTPITPYTASPLDGYGTPANRVTVTATAFPIVVGSGGAGSTGFGCGTVGVNSTAFSKTSAGGGFGGKSGPGSSPNAGSAAGAGGSGGGGGGGPGGGGALGAGNTPSVTPSQGFPGGSGGPGGYGGGQGGGATVVGYSAVTSPGGNPDAPTKGTGATTSINGTPTVFAGGGGGGGWCGGTAPGNAGGAGGGGQGAFGTFTPNSTNTAGTVNTGGGGGGAMGSGSPGKSGGSGIVIIRYKIQ